MQALVTCQDFLFGFKTPLMPALNWEVYPGQHWTIVGDNGSGKTTLFKALLGMLTPLGGSCELSKKTRYIAQVEQEGSNIPARVCDLVAMGLEERMSFLNPFFIHQRRKRIHESIEAHELLKLKKRQFSSLSQGEKQRVYLAKTLISKPQLIFLDESTSAMDPRHVRRYFKAINDYILENNAAVVSISHHLDSVFDETSHILAFTEDRFIQGPRDEALSALKAVQARSQKS